MVAHIVRGDPCARARRPRALRPRADLEQRRRARGAARPAGPRLAAEKGFAPSDALDEVAEATKGALRGGRALSKNELHDELRERVRAAPAAVVSGLQEPPRGAHAVALWRGEGRSAGRLRAPVPARQAGPKPRGRRGREAVPSLLRAGRSRGLRRLDRCREAARQTPLEAGRPATCRGRRREAQGLGAERGSQRHRIAAGGEAASASSPPGTRTSKSPTARCSPRTQSFASGCFALSRARARC